MPEAHLSRENFGWLNFPLSTAYFSPLCLVLQLKKKTVIILATCQIMYQIGEIFQISLTSVRIYPEIMICVNRVFHPSSLKFPKGDVYTHCNILNANWLKVTSSDKEISSKVPALFRPFCMSHPKIKIHCSILPEKMMKTVFLDNYSIKNNFSIVFGKPFTTFHPDVYWSLFISDKGRFLHHFTAGPVSCWWSIKSVRY